MTITQVFCTLNEILEGSELRGSEVEARIFSKILSASQILAMRVGHFLPVIEESVLGARQDSKKLFLSFPLLSLSNIVNDGVTLQASDYLLLPNQRHWANGPYSYLEIVPDAQNISYWDTQADGIVINGKVGLYDELVLLDATLAEAIASSTDSDIKVSNAAEVSPGIVLLIGSEWMFVRQTKAPVLAVTTLGAALDANSSICTLTNGALVNVGEVMRVDLEQMRIQDISGNQAEIQRGWNKTNKVSHNSGANVDVYRNFKVERGVNGSTATTHSQSAAISRQQAPADVNELTRKIAVRMLKDAATGYAGRVGDETLGQATYTYILPHELDEILDRYRITKAG